MEKVTGALHVFFEDPFWVGIFEKNVSGKLYVCRVVFGAEPKDYDVYRFILSRYDQLIFSPAVEADRKLLAVNPKRRQRQIGKEMKRQGAGTKAQQALKLQQEQKKTEKSLLKKEQRTAEQKRIFQLHRQKKKEKHRGR